MSTTITMWRLRHGTITRVECTKVTSGRTWPADGPEHGEPRITHYTSYHQTWAEAHAVMLAKAERDLTTARRQLEKAQGDYGRIKGMKPPVEGEAV